MSDPYIDPQSGILRSRFCCSLYCLHVCRAEGEFFGMLRCGERPREVVLMLKPSKSAITLQSLNVNYGVLPCPNSAVRAL
jgi:hypothetical protein